MPTAVLLLAALPVPACQRGEAPALPDGVSMEPVGADGTGCAMFQPRTASGSVVQAVYYRRAGGGFTMRRGEADCAPPPGGPA